MGAGASAQEVRVTVEEAKAGGATDGDIREYCRSNRLAVPEGVLAAQRRPPPPASAPPPEASLHDALVGMGFPEDGVAIALMEHDDVESAAQWLLEHPDVGVAVASPRAARPPESGNAAAPDDEEQLHYAIAASIMQRSRAGAADAEELALVPWATEMVDLHERRLGGGRQVELRERFVALRVVLAKERERLEDARQSSAAARRAGPPPWAAALREVDDLRARGATGATFVSRIKELEDELLAGDEGPGAARRRALKEREAAAGAATADAAQEQRLSGLLRRAEEANALASATREDVMTFCQGPRCIGKETLERVYLYLKDKVHNKEPLEEAHVRETIFGPQGVDEDAGAELVPKVLELILIEEDELLLKNLIKGIFSGAVVEAPEEADLAIGRLDDASLSRALASTADRGAGGDEWRSREPPVVVFRDAVFAEDSKEAARPGDDAKGAGDVDDKRAPDAAAAAGWDGSAAAGWDGAAPRLVVAEPKDGVHDGVHGHNGAVVVLAGGDGDAAARGRPAAFRGGYRDTVRDDDAPGDRDADDGFQEAKGGSCGDGSPSDEFAAAQRAAAEALRERLESERARALDALRSRLDARRRGAADDLEARGLGEGDVAAALEAMAARDAGEERALDASLAALVERAEGDLRDLLEASRLARQRSRATLRERLQRRWSDRRGALRDNGAGEDALALERDAATAREREAVARLDGTFEALVAGAAAGLESAVDAALRRRLDARSALAARLEKRASERRADAGGGAAGDAAAAEVLAANAASLAAFDGARELPEGLDLAKVVADLVAAHDATSRERAAALGAARRRRAADLLRRRDARRRDAAKDPDGDLDDVGVSEELADWAAADAEGARSELAAFDASQASLYGAVLGHCAAAGAPTDAYDVAGLVLEHDAARAALVADLDRRHGARRAALLARVRVRGATDADGDAELLLLEEQLGDERFRALAALLASQQASLRGQVLLDRADPTKQLSAVDAASAGVREGLRLAAEDLDLPAKADDGALRSRAAALIGEHAAEQEAKEHAFAEERSRQHAALRSRLKARCVPAAPGVGPRSDEAVDEELAEWAELEHDLARRELKATRDAHAKFCGEAFGICEAAGHRADMATVTALVRDHDGALGVLAGDLAKAHARKRADLVARLRDKHAQREAALKARLEAAAESEREREAKGEAAPPSPRGRLRELAEEVEATLAALDAELESERRREMHAFVTRQRAAVLEAIERSGRDTMVPPGSLVVAAEVAPAPEAKADDAEYHRLFVDLADAEAAAAEKRLERQRSDARRQRDAIERRLERRRSTSKPKEPEAKPLPVSTTTQMLARQKFVAPKKPLPDIVAQIEQARDANSLAHQLHTKRQYRHLHVKPAAPAPLRAPPTRDAADLARAPARTSVRQGMGFSSSAPRTPSKKADEKGGWG